MLKYIIWKAGVFRRKQISRADYGNQQTAVIQTLPVARHAHSCVGLSVHSFTCSSLSSAYYVPLTEPVLEMKRWTSQTLVPARRKLMFYLGKQANKLKKSNQLQIFPFVVMIRNWVQNPPTKMKINRLGKGRNRTEEFLFSLISNHRVNCFLAVLKIVQLRNHEREGLEKLVFILFRKFLPLISQ